MLSDRHLEMLYATLTAWGMHRMGDTKTTKAKLREWPQFRDSLRKRADILQGLLGKRMLEISRDEYSDALQELRPYYESLELSMANATVVANSKALYHLLPDLVPPIDRQYTLRFFTHPPEKWLDRKGKFRQIQLPAPADEQFELFRTICMKIKLLADQIDPALFEHQAKRCVTAPKALDNAIVNFVRRTSPRNSLAIVE